MPYSLWEKRLESLQDLILKPIRFNDLQLTLIDAVHAAHERGWQVGEHRHPWFEFNYVSAGCLLTDIAQVSFPTGAGRFFLIPPGVAHGNRNDGNDCDDGFCLRWQIERAADEPDGLYDRLLKALTVMRPFSLEKDEIGRSIDALLSARDSFRQQLAILELLRQLLALWEEPSTIPRHDRSRQDLIVRQAILYLSEYYAQPIAVADVARSLNVSYRHLARTFRQVTGVTIIEKLNDIRINRAKMLLRQTDMTIKEIARRVGFENEFYFSKTFGRSVFTSPSEFRRQYYEMAE